MRHGNQSISGFLDDIATRNVTPAGGTATAVVGATGASLCEMACIHTVENDRYSDVAAELADVRDALERQRTRLLELADRDAEAVDDLLAASDDEALQAAAKRSTGVPLTIAEACLDVINYATVVTEKGNPNAIPDAGTGAFLAHAALQAAIFTVRYNVERIEDASFVEEMERRTGDIETSAESAFDQVLANIEAER